MPAVEYDSNGNNLVTFYDRQLDCTNNFYNYMFVQTDARGNILQATTVASAFQTDPAADPRPHAAYNFIGDYQGVWFSGGIFYGAWIGAHFTPDVYLTRIQ